MDTSYRRRARVKTSSSRGKKSGTDWRTAILMQCIVSGMVLCVLLLVSLLNTKFTNNLRNNLKMAISGPTTLDEVKENAAEATGVFLNAQDDLKTLFGNRPEAEPAAAPAPSSAGPLTDPEEGTNTSDGTTDFRIDEDILEEMKTRKDAYTDDFF